MMDFVSGLQRVRKGNDEIWVIGDQMTKSALFLPMKMTYPDDKLAKLYVNEVIRLHGSLIYISAMAMYSECFGDEVESEHFFPPLD
jgi:hypothetical protein